MKTALVILACFLFAFFTPSSADVKYVSTTSMQLEGSVGTMMKLFGGGKPVKTVDYYKDNQKRSDTLDKKDRLESSQLIDLDKELFFSIDHKKKKYRQMTFDEWKELMQAKMEQLSREEYGDGEEQGEPQADVDWDLKVDVKETGEKSKIAGKNTEKVILTLDLDAEATSTEVEEGQEPETVKGGLIVTSSHWVYNGDENAKKEMENFNKRLAEKMGFLPGASATKDMMTQIFKQNPQLGDAIETMQKEGKKLQGISMRIETRYETKIDPETAKKIKEEKAKQQSEDEKMEIPTSVGGLLGGLGKKMAKKHMAKKDEGVKERNALMKSTTEVIELDRAVLDASLFEIPSKYELVVREAEK